MKKFVFIAFAGMCLFGCNAGELDFDNIKGPSLSGTFGFPLGEVKYMHAWVMVNNGVTFPERRVEA